MIFDYSDPVHVVADVVTHGGDVVVEQFLAFSMFQMVWHNMFGRFEVLMPELDGKFLVLCGVFFETVVQCVTARSWFRDDVYEWLRS